MKLKPGQKKLFRGLNGPRKEEKWTCGSHLKKIKKKKIKRKENGCKGYKDELFFFFKFFFFSLLSSQIHGNLTVGIRRVKNEKMLYATRATRGYQKHGISPRIQVKIWKIQIFSFSQIYRILVVRIFRTKS